MSLQDYKITNYAVSIQSLPDKIENKASWLKAQFDARTDTEVKNSINGLIDELSTQLENTYTKEQTDAIINDKIVQMGAGDMAKAVYDPNDDGVVDKAQKLAQPAMVGQAQFDGSAPITLQQMGAAPISHADTAGSYGVAGAEKYGHVRLSDDTADLQSTKSLGVAATPAAVALVAKQVQTAQTTANAAMPKTGGDFSNIVRFFGPYYTKLGLMTATNATGGVYLALCGADGQYKDYIVKAVQQGDALDIRLRGAADKVANALVIKSTAGYTQATFDGSSAKTVTLTKGMVGLDKVNNNAISMSLSGSTLTISYTS